MDKRIKLIQEVLEKTNDLLLETKKIGIDKLPYGFDSLTRFIDEKTMKVHYNKHYKGYVEKLVDALSKKEYKELGLEDIITKISKFPKIIRNNGGGAFNHSLFWKMLTPDKKVLKGEILKKINKDFGSFNNFKKQFQEISLERFGSGWCWLVLTKNNKLKIMTTPNQDNPLMNVVEGGGYPLLGLDLWEHAYYLKYQNKRDDYIKNFWSVVNWDYVNSIYELKTKKKIEESYTITKKDFLLLLEDDQLSMFNKNEFEKDYLNYFCNKKNTSDENKKVYCDLIELRNEIGDEQLVKDLNDATERIVKFFNVRNTSALRKIFNVALYGENSDRTINFLKIISDFIADDNYSESVVKKKLLKIKDQDIISNDLNEVLRQVRELEYAKYEKSFEGKQFEIKQTKLELNYSCDPGDVSNLFTMIDDVKSKKQEFANTLKKIKTCVTNSLNSEIPPIKTDLVSKEPLYIEELVNGELVQKEIFPANSHFEVKKMDVEIDSYLSEFFSIFKQSTLKTFKQTHSDLYNVMIRHIYDFVKKNGQEYLNKIREKLAGVIFDNNIIVPINNIYFYWSNKGQRGCDELRLSIRFRVFDLNGKIETYKYTYGSNVLTKNDKQISDSFLKKYQGEIMC
jgi:Fe-Mn family superoxide dismutase